MQPYDSQDALDAFRSLVTDTPLERVLRLVWIADEREVDMHPDGVMRVRELLVTQPGEGVKCCFLGDCQRDAVLEMRVPLRAGLPIERLCIPLCAWHGQAYAHMMTQWANAGNEA